GDPARRVDCEEEAHVFARDDLVLNAEPLIRVVIKLAEKIPAAERDDARIDPAREKRAVGQSLVIEVEKGPDDVEKSFGGVELVVDEGMVLPITDLRHETVIGSEAVSKIFVLG